MSTSQPEQPDQPPDLVSTDVVVVGGGPAGENIVDRVRAGGLDCVLVESELFGGECSYWACVPSKAMLRPVEMAAAATRLPGVPTGKLDAGAVLKRRDWFTGYDGHRHDDSSQEKWVEGTGTVAMRGLARLDGARRVVVQRADGTRAIEARQAVVLAVGSDPAVPPVPGLREAKPWTSRDATSAEHVPERLVVLGGGVVACEMAQAYRGLGAREVSIVELLDRLLGRTEPFAGEMIATALRDAGIDVRVSAHLTKVERPEPGGEVTLTLADGTTLTADEVLVATGRRPRTTDLGLESVGLEPGRTTPTDDWLRVQGVDGDWLYAVGDVNGRNLLTHMGKYQGRLCADVIVSRARGEEPPEGLRARADTFGAPSVVFTDPQVASVGRTEAEAREAGVRVRTVEYDIGSVSGASLLADGYRGRAKIVVDEDRRVVVGATFVGQDVAELLHSATVAVVGEVPLDSLWHAVPSYPTISEVWLRLLETYGL
jgi:dihydrolipoamide dehydrogenase